MPYLAEGTPGWYLTTPPPLPRPNLSELLKWKAAGLNLPWSFGSSLVRQDRTVLEKAGSLALRLLDRMKGASPGPFLGGKIWFPPVRWKKCFEHTLPAVLSSIPKKRG